MPGQSPPRWHATDPAAGGVGHLAVQIAKARGAIVTGTTSAAKIEFVEGLGADAVIDHHAVDLADAVRDVEVVFDLVGGEFADRSIPLPRPGGLLTTVLLPTVLEHRNAALKHRTEVAGRRFAGLTVEPDGAGLESLAALVEAGQLTVQVQRAFPLADAAAAHRLIDGSAGRGSGTGVTGKLVLVP